MKKLFFTLGLALLGILMPRISLADDNIPKADILDVVFNDDGTAYDASPMDNKVEVIGKEMMTTYYNENYKRVVPRLSNPWSGNGATYYKVDYENNQAFKDAIANGHTLELLVMADYTIGSLPDAECKPFSSHQSGGTGLMVAKTNKSANGTNDFAFLPHTGGSYRWVLSGVHPEPGIYYHVVGVYNKEEGKGYIYVNGELKGTADTPGDFQFASAGNVWFGIGADPNGATGNTAWNGEVAIARIYDTPLKADQIAALYKQVEVNRPDYRQLLKNSLDSINAIGDTFPEGTNPGYYTAEALSQYKTAYDDIALKALNAIEGSVSDDEYITLRTDLLNAYNAIHEHANPISNGYYYFINAYPTFKQQQGVDKAMCINADKELSWDTFNSQSALQLFKVTKLEDGNYSIQNTASGEYINTIAGKSSLVPMSATQETPQTFTLLHSGEWNIANTKNTEAYHTLDHKGGAGTDGRIVTWSAGVETGSAWYLHAITDQALIDKLLASGPKQVMANKLKKAIENTAASRLKADDYTALITSAGQIASNSKAQDGSLANLIDGNTETIFHSEWNAIMADANTSEGIGWHNLQITLGKEISKMKFHFNGRNNSSGWHDNPTHITLYGTNDDALGTSTASADSLQWTEIVDMKKDAYGFPGNENAVSYNSPVIDLKGSYKYLRFVVKHVSTMDGGNRKTAFAVPSITGVTFNFSEFQVYDGNPAETSEYFKVTGMKEACDAYDKLVAEAQEKITNLTVTEADIEAITAAAKAIEDLYVDRDVFDNKLAELTTKANKIYDTATGSQITLITNAAQFSSNNSSPRNFSSFEHLIDGVLDYHNCFHSFWGTEMQRADITADEWIATMNGEADAIHTGTGYHNLQVKLDEPIKNFWFEYIGRTGTSYVDNPTDIEVYVTNDDELGATTDQADIDKWTLLTKLTEGFPGAEQGARYVSPELKLESGETFKYVRFVIKNTAMAGTKAARTFNNPDVTGITWNVGEWQMYSGLDKDRIQYNYVPGMKEACDAMKAILDVAEKMGKHEMVTSEFNDKFEAAINAVEALYADTTELAALYKKYNTLVNSAVIGTGVGYVDTQEAVDAFAAVIKEAKATVDPIQPTKASIDAAVAKITEAYSIFDSHVGKVEAGKWYHILSAAAEGDQAVETVLPAREVRGAALYVTSSGDGFGSVEGDYKYGNQLRWGMDDVKFKEMAVDPDAMWQFIAAPEQGENVYYIQNMRKGSYIGNSNGSTNPYDPYYYDSAEPMPFRLDPIGAGQFNIVAIGDANNPGAIGAGDNARQIRGDMTTKTGINQRTSWTIEPIDPSIDAITLTYPSNSVQVVTLPYSVSNISTINEGVQTYTIHSQVSATELALIKKDEFAAGEPFVMTIGDLTQYEDDHSNVDISIVLPTDITAKADTVNGLVGVLSQRSVKGNGYGFIENAVLKVLAEDKSASIGSQSGYIVPSLIEAQEGEYDLLLTTEGALGIKQVAGSNDALVNVYTIDGKLLKRNVKASEALKNLKKGIYIVGKKKVSVK